MDNNEKIFADERRTMIVELLNKEMKKSVSDLCEIFHVSPATMRNDLTVLEQEGLLKRTHGGAISKKKVRYEPTSSEKVVTNTAGKQLIASIAANYVQEGDVIILDTGSTVLELAKQITNIKELTVITYDFDIVNYLDEYSDAMVIFLGGQLRRNFHCATGPQVISALSELNADRVFLGSNAISHIKGLSTPNLELATIKKEMIRVSDEKIVLCDATKLNKTSFAKFAEFSDVDLIITDEMPDKEFIERAKSVGVSLEYPGMI